MAPVRPLNQLRLAGPGLVDGTVQFQLGSGERRKVDPHAALFGSVAPGEGKRTSEIDVLIELDPQAPIGFSNTLGSRNTCRLALGPGRCRQPQQFEAARPADIERDAIYAF